MKTLALVLLVVALPALASACGGGGSSSSGTTATTSTTLTATAASTTSGGAPLSKRAYERRMSKLFTQLTQAYGGLGAVNPLDPASSARLLDRLASGLDVAADKLEAINPPAAVARAHERLVAAVRSWADELHDRASEARKAGSTKALSGISKLPGFAAIQSALEQLAARGFSITPGGATITVQGGGG